MVRGEGEKGEKGESEVDVVRTEGEGERRDMVRTEGERERKEREGEREKGCS